MSAACFVLSLAFFGVAAIIDRPWHYTTTHERIIGNFCCSLGNFFLVAALFLRAR